MFFSEYLSRLLNKTTLQLRIYFQKVFIDILLEHEFLESLKKTVKKHVKLIYACFSKIFLQIYVLFNDWNFPRFLLGYFQVLVFELM